MHSIHFITGEYPPRSGGVGDYTEVLAAKLAELGEEVHVWTSGNDSVQRQESGVTVHRIAGTWDKRDLKNLGLNLARFPDKTVVVQYAPNAMGKRGLNVRFCSWLRDLRAHDTRVMFHEPFFYFGIRNFHRNALAIIQRVMAMILLRASNRIYLSTPQWERLLRPYARKDQEMIVLPISSTIPRPEKSVDVDRTKKEMDIPADAIIIGHFGSYPHEQQADLSMIFDKVLRSLTNAHALFIGRGGDVFRAQFIELNPVFASRAHATGDRQPAVVGQFIGACTLMVQPYPDGITARRTSALAALASEIPVVTTDGFWTESFWRNGFVKLAPAGNNDAIADAVTSLATDRSQLERLAQLGKQEYDGRFDIRRAAEIIMQPPLQRDVAILRRAAQAAI